MQPILHTAGGNPENQDRGLILQDAKRLVMCVADGAGGLSGGTEAAVKAIEWVGTNVSSLVSAESCTELLRSMDTAVAKDSVAGETTCALIVVTPREIFGASVGDSGIFLIPDHGANIDLTRGQRRKPFIGSNSSSPVSFRETSRSGLLLLATDGLLKYTSPERIAEVFRQHAKETTTERLIELVRYPSGTLPDDVTIILTKL